VAHGLVRAVTAFLSTLAGGAMVRKERDQGVARGRGRPPHRPGIENRCPVCQARFRGARFCSRCGADLEPLMRLTVKAWQLRQAARQALEAGDVERALGLAMEAQGVQGTGSGEALLLLGAWLTTV
jgi:hypothetical protein